MPATASLSLAIDQVSAARTPYDLFGDSDAVGLYRALARVLHPDVGGDTDAFARLQQLWTQYTRQEAAGTYGGYSIRSRKTSYSVGGVLASGDVATVFNATTEAGERVVVKVVRSPKNASLLIDEARALGQIARDGDDEFADFVPKARDYFKYREKDTGVTRSVVVLEPLDGFYTLTQVRDAYPIGLDARDMAWMFRRLLVALGHAHDAGVFHGAVTPDHVMIHPEMHGLVLIDWTLAGANGKVPFRIKRWEGLYPEELERGRELDVHMAAKTMGFLLRDTAPTQMRAFLKGCSIGKMPHPWALKGEFEELLVRLYGPPRFRPFVMPTTTGD